MSKTHLDVFKHVNDMSITCLHVPARVNHVFTHV